MKRRTLLNHGIGALIASCLTTVRGACSPETKMFPLQTITPYDAVQTVFEEISPLSDDEIVFSREHSNGITWCVRCKKVYSSGLFHEAWLVFSESIQDQGQGHIYQKRLLDIEYIVSKEVVGCLGQRQGEVSRYNPEEFLRKYFSFNSLISVQEVKEEDESPSWNVSLGASHISREETLDGDPVLSVLAHFCTLVSKSSVA